MKWKRMQSDAFCITGSNYWKEKKHKCVKGSVKVNKIKGA